MRRTKLCIMLDVLIQSVHKQVVAGDVREKLLPPRTDLAAVPDELRGMVRDAGVEVADHELTLGYSYWPADHILKVGCWEGGVLR